MKFTCWSCLKTCCFPMRSILDCFHPGSAQLLKEVIYKLVKNKPTWRLPTYGRIRRCAVRELSWGGGGLVSRGGRGVVDHLGGLVPVCQSECVVSHQSRQLVARSVDVVWRPRARLQGACEWYIWRYSRLEWRFLPVGVTGSLLALFFLSLEGILQQIELNWKVFYFWKWLLKPPQRHPATKWISYTLCLNPWSL